MTKYRVVASNWVIFLAILSVFIIFPELSNSQTAEESYKLNQEAIQLSSQGRYKEAIPLHERALAIREKIYGPVHSHVALSLHNLGSCYRRIGDYERAESLLKRALSIWEKTEGAEHPHTAIGLNALGGLYFSKGDYSSAKILHQRALSIQEKKLAATDPKIAETLTSLANPYNILGEYNKAQPLYNRALQIQEKALGPDHPAVATSIENLAQLYHALGDYDKAGSLFNRALQIREKAQSPEHPELAISINYLAELYYSLGDYNKAEPLFKRALAILDKAFGPEHPSVANSLSVLAKLYSALGDYSKAEFLSKKSLQIREKSLGPEHPSVANSLTNIAMLYTILGNYGKAEPMLKRALQIREKALGSEHKDVASILNELGYFYEQLGDYSKAEPLFKRSLQIREKALDPNHPDVKQSLNNSAMLSLLQGRNDQALDYFKKRNNAMGLGRCYLAAGNFEEARKNFQRSLDEQIRSGNKHWVITDHIGLGFSFEGLGDLAGARDHFRRAIELIEEQWQSLGPSAKNTFLDGKVGLNFSRLDAYEGMVRVILKEKKAGYVKEALLYSERVKSRTLLEMLAARGAQGKQKGDSEVLGRDRQFQQEIAMLKQQISILTELGPKAPEGDKERAEGRLAKALQDYEGFINEVKLQDKELASLITVEATPIELIQALLDSSSTIVEYFITKDCTYAWVITREDIKVQELALGRDKLVAMVNELLLPNISNKTRRPAPIITLSTGESKEAQTDTREKNLQQFSKGTQDAYGLLLQPLEKDLRTKNLIVVPHGVLHKIPFAALNNAVKFMVDTYSLCQVPSSSVIEYVVKKRNENLERLLAFANPHTDYVPLEFAEIEVKQISSLFSRKDLFFKGEATEGQAKAKASDADVIHFACHGEFNDRQPMQSGLMLTKDADNDGVLQVHEIFGLDLKNANLVVLSACDTALSKIQGGDDLVGLSRGFIYAGAPSILATLWEVDDNSTAILMKAFYENWQKKGMSKPEALRMAQMSLKSMPQYGHPFYWAPFILIGDWL